MDLERLLANALALQAIPSPTFEERERAVEFRARLIASGWGPVHLDPVGNVLGRLGDASAPAVVVCAHLDSVFLRPEHRPARRVQDHLSGPGIGDNALGLAVVLELASDLMASPPAACIWLAATVAEEGLGNLRGMYALVESLRSQACAYIVVEGMTLGHVYHRGLPARRLRVSLRTSGGHSWTHAGRPSAVHEIIRLANRLIQLPLPSRPRTTLNLGRIEGGTAINAIAAHASLELDLRSEDEKVVAGLESAVLHQAQMQAGPEVQVECTAIGSRPGGGLPASHPLVAAAVASLKAQGVEDVQLGAGSTDASAPLSLGIPAVCLGVTSGHMAHSQEERVDIPPMARGYAAVLATVVEAARLARAGLL